MSSQALVMSGNARSRAETPRADLDRAVDAVRGRAREFARLPLAEKAALLRACVEGVLAEARGWVEEACRAKGIDFDRPVAGEEWLAGPVTTMRNLRLLIESLESIRASGKPALGTGVRRRPDGRIAISVFPGGAKESALFAGFAAECLMLPGVSEHEARERQASFYDRTEPEGGVSLVLGAGNVSSIPPTDCLYKMFVDGNVCVLKMNPVNEWVGPYLERAFAPLVRRDYLRVVYGGADAGAYLVGHAGIDDIHITGSDRTHDLIVWGPPGPERERRKKANDPLLKKTITSELGNVSPVAIVPGDYTAKELDFQARNVVTMVANNGSFNCNAGKVLVTGKGWAQRGLFLDLVRKRLAEVPPRKAYYPGAFDRYDSLLAGRTSVEKFGAPAERGPAEGGGSDALPWAFVPGLDAEDREERLFRVEPFCGLMCETGIASADPVEFLDAATAFMNDRLWGTLNAAIVISPRAEADPKVAAALDRAIVDLRYGTVAINHWPAIGYGFVTTPWGGHPSATLADVQSGIGWVHNSFMLQGIEKAVVRGPITVFPTPAWFTDNAQTHRLAEKLLRFEADPGWLKVPGLAITALLG